VLKVRSTGIRLTLALILRTTRQERRRMESILILAALGWLVAGISLLRACNEEAGGAGDASAT
jgi:hypothetical protein